MSFASIHLIEISYNKGKIEVVSENEHSFVFLIKERLYLTDVSSRDAFHDSDTKSWIEVEKRGKKFTLIVGP